MNKLWKVISWTFDWLGFFCDRVVIYADNQRFTNNIKEKIQIQLKKGKDGIREYDIAISTGPQWLTLDERKEEK